MADLKKSFDEVREAASGLTGGNLMTKLADTLGEPPKLEDFDKPAADTPAASAEDIAASGPTPQEVPIPETFTEADAQALAAEPLAITREFQNATPAEPAPASHETPSEVIKDAKAS
jgi:sec-independent protein translocase protein TatB